MLPLIQAPPEIFIFLSIIVGFFVGKVRIKNVCIGSVAGTLIVGLIVGLIFKPHISDLLRWAFFDLFLFCLGYSIGPQFFTSLKKESIAQVALAVVVAITGLCAALLAAWVLKLGPGLSSGLLSGSLTQPTALGTSLGAIHDMNSLSEAKKIILSVNAPLADTITYVMGEVGLILFAVVIAPLLLRINLKEEGQKLDEVLGTRGDSMESDKHFFYKKVAIRAYILSNPEMIGQTIEKVEKHFAKNRLVICKVIRANQSMPVSRELILQCEDVVTVMVLRNLFMTTSNPLGEETTQAGALDVEVISRTMIVKNKKCIGKTIDELAKEHGRGLFLCRIHRGQTEIPVASKTTIERGDTLELFGSPESIAKAEDLTGGVEREIGPFDLAILGTSIAIGALMAALQWRTKGIPSGMGATGTILISGLLAGWASSRFQMIPNIPEKAIGVLQEIGLKVFIATVGLIAGPRALEIISTQGVFLFVEIFIAGLFVTMAGPCVGLLFGHHVLRMRSSLLIAGICGAQTCIGALNALRDATRTNAVTLGFTVTFALSNVLLTIWGAIMVGVSQLWMT